MTATNLSMKLEISSKPDVTLDVQGFEGTEAISELFRFVVNATTSNSVTVSSLVGERAKFTLTTQCGESVTWGILGAVTELDPTPTELRVLQFELRPRFAVAELSSENRIFCTGSDITVPTVLSEEMARTDITVPVEYNEFDTYPPQKYFVQYDETDFAFISRVCERVGIFYFFKQGNDGETVSFGDKNVAFPHVDFGGGKGATILYSHPKDRHLPRGVDEAAVLSFTQRNVISTKTVKVRDYNEAAPRVASAEKEAGSTGYLGTMRFYGGHFADDTEGGVIAKARAELIAAGHAIVTGKTDAPELRAGMIFTLDGHPTLNGEYLVVRATHSARRPAPVGFNALPDLGQPYQSTIECIKSSVAFRPARVTPRPNAGLHVATVDGPARPWSNRAEIDGEGRYKLQLKFSDSDCAAANGSDYVRKIEPYLGPQQTGLYFPLVAGTEVIVGYLNGDIDRPVVIGAVSTPSWKSVVTSGDHLYNRIKSQSGAMVEIYDGT